MLNTIYLIVAIVFLILMFVIFMEYPEIAFIFSFFGELLVVAIFVIICKAPCNLESKTITYAIAQQTHQQFYITGAANESIAVLINDNGTLKQKTFDETITEIVVGETDTPKVEITGEYQKYDYLTYKRTGEPEKYTKVVIYVPKES